MAGGRKTLLGLAALLIAATAPLSAAMAQDAPPAAVTRHFDLSTATVADINAAMDAGALTSERLVELYLARIAAYDQQGPALNSIITLNPRALEQARALDAERRERGPRGPLHGTVVLAKDVFDTADMPTTGGFAPMAASQPDRDAFVIERLRAQGVVILGKLNLADWYGEVPGSGSSLTGTVNSPYVADRYPGASSSGSGVAAAAWFATATLGSDTGGSLMIPGALNAVVSIAPTRGLVSRRGMMWNSPRQENAGPMTRSVYDAAAMLDAMAGFDVGDLTTQQSLGRLPEGSYTRFIDPDGLRGLRVGVLREMVRGGPAHVEGRDLFERELAAMRAAGAVVLDPVLTGLDLPSTQAAASSGAYEQALAADHYLSTLPPGAPMRSLDEMIAKGGDQVGASLRAIAGLRSLDRHPQFLAAVRQQDMLRNALVDLMQRYDLDVLVLPYRTVGAPRQGERIDADMRAQSRNGLHAYTGLPGILVPGGFFQDGMPFSVEFMGRSFDEPTVLRAASGYEAVTHRRRPPPLTPPLPGEFLDYRP